MVKIDYSLNSVEHTQTIPKTLCVLGSTTALASFSSSHPANKPFPALLLDSLVDSLSPFKSFSLSDEPEPTTSKQEPTTSEAEPTTSKPDPTTSKPEPTTSKPQSTTSKPEPTTSEPEPTTSKPEPTTSKQEPTTSKSEPTTSKPEPTTPKPEPTTSKPEPTTSKPEPTTSTPEPTTPKPEPTTPKPEPTTPKPPSTTVDCSTMDGMFADPGNCGGFIQCVHGTTFHMSCGAGTYFDEIIFNCNWPYNTECGDRPILQF